MFMEGHVRDGNKVIKHLAPNGWGIRILELASDDGEPPVFLVQEEVTEGDDPWNQITYWEEGVECATLAEAEEAFEKRLAELRETPNHAAQARYDEEHGTVNGYDPRIEEMRELWGE
jgi:hypothetical protein